MSELWARAVVARKSAQLLLNAGDAVGAVNRAYYAMFDAARAALEVAHPDLASAKTHATVIRRFGRHIVGVKGVDRSHGRALNLAESQRLDADSEKAPIGLSQAQSIVQAMERFLDALEPFVKEGQLR